MSKQKEIKTKATIRLNAKLTSYRFKFIDNDKSECTFSILAKSKLEAKALLLEKIENEIYKKTITEKLNNSSINKVNKLAIFEETIFEHDSFNTNNYKYEEDDYTFETTANTITPLWIDELINEPWYKNN